MFPERRETDRFILRSFEPGDGEALVAAKRDSYHHLAPWLPWAERSPSLEEEETLVRRFRARWLLGEDFVVSAWRPGDGVLMGGSGFHLRSGTLVSRQAEIGMWMAAAHAGKGNGTALLVAMLSWGFAEWGFLRLGWQCSAANVASRRVAEKAGMQHEGTLRGEYCDVTGRRRDTLVFAALSHEWAPPDIAAGNGVHA